MGDAAPPGMTSQRPYLLRALYEWIADNGMTPHVLVDARLPGVRVPAHAVQDGRIVLNIAERAVAKLDMSNEALRFSARFGGVATRAATGRCSRSARVMRVVSSLSTSNQNVLTACGWRRYSSAA